MHGIIHIFHINQRYFSVLHQYILKLTYNNFQVKMSVSTISFVTKKLATTPKKNKNKKRTS